ncbi:GPI transamidase component [Ascosphaera aggregata]|nr:GPI transamidase component [Ascosphaera aggregata]
MGFTEGGVQDPSIAAGAASPETTLRQGDAHLEDVTLDTSRIAVSNENSDSKWKQEERSAAAANSSFMASALPTENPAAIKTRLSVVLSFWAVVVFLGLPLWWKTTTVHREDIPMQEMQDWANGKAPSIPSPEAEVLIQMTQHTLDDLNDFSAHHLRLRLLNPSEEPLIEADQDTALTINLSPQDDADLPDATLAPLSEILDIHYPPNLIPSPSKTTSSSTLATFIASEVQKLFTEEKASIAYILSESNTLSPTTQPAITSGSGSHRYQTTLTSNREQGASVVRSLDPELAHNLARRKTRAFKYAATYHLSISLFTPGPSPSSWEIEAAIEEYMAALLKAFSPISNFTIDTQVQVYATFSDLATQPVYDKQSKAWYLKKENLGSFINAAEWPLSPSIGEGPTINFVLYVPASNQSPLYIKDTKSTSWTIPQWGGIHILNVAHENADLRLDMPAENPKHLKKEDLRPAMTIFSHQLFSLLGVPASPASYPLRFKTLIRIHIASLLLSASSTMGSLARLTRSIQSIPIPTSVANAVSTTLSHLTATCEHLREGRFVQALAAARIAETEAEKGFFDKSMVGQAYFPDEHKVAVYLPFLGPVGVPLVIGLLKEIRRLIFEFKNRRKAAALRG